MRSLSALSIVLLLLASCAGRVSNREPSQAATEPQPSRDTFALGTQLTRAGAVPANAAGEQFLRPGEVFLSVAVTGASADQTIGVEWVDPSGRVIRKDKRTVPAKAEYAPFSSGSTSGWKAGQHRAVVIINGRRVTERQFAMM